MRQHIIKCGAKVGAVAFFILHSALFTSCGDRMDYNEYNTYEKDWFEQNFQNIGRFMTDIYNTMDFDFGNYSSGAMLASATDESEYSIMGNAIEDYYNGSWSASNPKKTLWANMYKGITTANDVLLNFQGLKFEELELNSDYEQQMHRYENYQYEARLMRAYFYFQLARQYGGVPIVKEGMTTDEINSLGRSTVDEVLQFVISECEDIEDKIISDYTNLGDYALGTIENGRADRLSVLALKARAALYMASPLFNESGDTERWHTAATYYKQLLAACDERGKGLTTKYADLWSTNNYTTAAITKEIIFGRRYYTSNAGDHLVESYNYPVGIENGKGGNCPTQNLVDAYNMADGTPITDPASGYDEQNPYQNRDPRLAATIAVNGDVWPTYQTKALQTYFGGTNGEPLTGATPTGYYLKKLCHGEISLASNATTANNYHTYVIFRMGGFWLDYAEALFRYLGSADATTTEFPVSAREAASKTRVRAGIPELPTGLSNTDFWTRYKQERMVELCFEGYRFWDVRRWKEAPQYFTSITEMKITRADDGTLTYTRQQQSRQWDDKMYFYPIPQTERMKNPNLTQNSGW